MTSERDFTYDELCSYFHKPINEVSLELGICATLLKKICRKNGIKRWPHRKIKSLDNMIDSFEKLYLLNPHDKSILNDIEFLKGKRDFLLKNPNVPYNSVLPKHTVNAYNARIQKTNINDLLIQNNCSNSFHPNHLKPLKTIKKKKSYPRRSTRNVEKEYYFNECSSTSNDNENNDLSHYHYNSENSDDSIGEEAVALLLVQLQHRLKEEQILTENLSKIPAKLRWKQEHASFQDFPSPGLKVVSNYLPKPHII